MFRQSSYLLDNFQKFFKNGEEINPQTQSFQPISRNFNKNAEDFFSRLSQNQKVRACKVCQLKESQYITLEKQCKGCQASMCRKCQRENECAKCYFSFCNSCLGESVNHFHEYIKVCFRCEENSEH